MSKKFCTPKFWSICLGNFFEHYDGALFGFLSPFLAPLIFPNTEYITALILTYAMIPLGMIARPIGAIVFGYIGDHRGRKEAFFLTLSGMAVISLLIAFSPTYASGGFIAPLVFCIGRVLQNFFAAGETMGGAIFLLEGSEKKDRDILSSLYDASTIGGILLASGGVALLSILDIVDFGWRFLYVFGAIVLFFGVAIRGQLKIEKAQEKGSLALLGNAKRFLAVVIASGFAYANYSMALVFMNGFVPLISSVTKVQMIQLNTFLLVLDFVLLPLFGWLASKIGRERLMLFASMGVILFSMPLFILLKGATLLGVFFIRAFFVLIGVAFFAPFHAWAYEVVSEKSRYIVISLGYALGSQLLGGPLGAFSLWIFKVTGSIPFVALYWIMLAFASFFTVLLLYKRQKQFKTQLATYSV
jgi:MHS family proline/betaine transporter-like MFS transporter